MNIITGPARMLIDWFNRILTYFEKFPILGTIIGVWKEKLEELIGVIKTVGGWFASLGRWIGKAVGDIHDYAEEIRAANKAEEDAKKTKEELAKGTSVMTTAMEREMLKVGEAKLFWDNLSGAHKENIKTLLASGKSAAYIADVLKDDLGVSAEIAEIAIKKFDDAMKEAAREAKKNPYAKLKNDLKELSGNLADAAAAGQPFAVVMEQYGKEAEDIVRRASLTGHLKDVKAEIIAVAEAFNAAQLADKLKPVNEKALELVRTFREKVKEGTTAATQAIKEMAADMVQSLLTGNAAAEMGIKRQTDSTVAGLEAQKTAIAKANTDLLVNQKQNSDKAVELAKQAAKDKGKTITAEEEATIRDQHVLQTNAAIAENNILAAQLTYQQGQVQENAVLQQQALYATTESYEKNAELRGVITDRANAEELARLRRTLELMKDARSNATQSEVTELERAIALKQDAYERDAQKRGVITETMRRQEIEDEEAKLASMKDVRSGAYAWEIAAQQAHVDNLRNVDQAEAAKRGLTTKKELADRVQQMEDHLAWMKRNAHLFTSAQIKEYELQVEAARRAAGSIKGIWLEALSKTANAARELGGAFTQIGEAANSKAMKSIGEGLDFSAVMVEGVMGILDAKDAIGAMIAVAKLAAQVIGKLWDAFTKSGGEAAAEEMEKTFTDATGKALEVTEEFGDEINAVAEDLFAGDRFAAQIYKLADVVEEAGGLSEKNFENMAGRLHNTFSLLERGVFTAEQATKTLDDNFGAFADHVVKSGKVASKAFTDIIRENAAMGTNSKVILDFVSKQAEVLGKAFQKQVGPVKKASDTLAADIKKVKEEIDKTLEKPGGRVDPKVQAQYDVLLKKQKEMATQSMPAIERAGRLMTASFNASIKAGVGMVEAMDQLGPGLDDILTSMKNLGVEVSESSVGYIAAFRDRVNANRELVDSAGSLNDIMLAMSNIGALNEETMADLQAQGKETYDQLIASGFSEREALTMQKGYLEQVRNAHKELGLPIDENTQALIDQAVQQGVMKEEQLSANDVMIEGFNAIITALGGTIPDAFKKMAQAGTDSAKKVTDAAKTSAKALGGVGGAADGVSTSLDNTDWEGWSEEAVAAARDAQAAVDAVSLGSSPGGIKEIPLKLKAAMAAFKEWERQGVISSHRVKDAVEAMQTTPMATGQLSTEVMRRNVAIEQHGDTTAEAVHEMQTALEEQYAEMVNNATPINFTISALDGADVKRVVEEKVQPALIESWRRGRGITALKEVVK